MEYAAILANLLLIHLLMAMVPGPNTVTVGYYAAGQSRRAGLITAAGVALASAIWLAASLAGLGALMLRAEWLLRAVRLVGAAYLIWVGLGLLLRRTAPPAARPQPIRARPFRAGLLTTLSNPKSALFWTSIFAVVLPPEAPLGFRLSVLGLITLQAFLWYGLVALVFSARRTRALGPRAGRIARRIAGLAMTGFGLRLVLDLRRELLARA